MMYVGKILSFIKLLRAKKIVLISTFMMVRASNKYSAGGNVTIDDMKQITI